MKNSINKILLTLAVLICGTVMLNAQIHGTVKDEYGKTLQGVLITSENGRNVAMTDKEGKYDLNINDESKLVVFSLKGYISQSIDILSDKIDVSLERAETYDLEEKINDGINEQTKNNVTGAISRVTDTDLRKSPVSNLSMSFAGHVPGLLSRETYSEPSRTKTDLFLRGYSSPNGGTALVVIDGFPYDYNANQLFEYISANEVESVSFLKDGAS